MKHFYYIIFVIAALSELFYVSIATEYKQEWRHVNTSCFTTNKNTLRYTGLYVTNNDISIISYGNPNVFSWFSTNDCLSWTPRITLHTGWVYPGNWSVYQDDISGQIIQFSGYPSGSGKLGSWLWDGISWTSNNIALTGSVATYYHPWWIELTNKNVGVLYKTDNSIGGGSSTELRYVELSPLRHDNIITNFSVVSGTDTLLTNYYPTVCDIALDPSADYRPRIVLSGYSSQRIKFAGLKADNTFNIVNLDVFVYDSTRLVINKNGTCYVTCVSDTGSANFYYYSFNYDEQNNILLNKVKLSQTDICTSMHDYYKSVIPVIDPKTDRPILTYTGVSGDYWGYYTNAASIYVSSPDYEGNWHEKLLDDDVMIDPRYASAHAFWNDIFVVAEDISKSFVYLVYPKFSTGDSVIVKYEFVFPKGSRFSIF